MSDPAPPTFGHTPGSNGITRSRHQPVRDPVETIVVGLDGEPASLRAAAYAVGTAHRRHADLLFLQVWHHRPTPDQRTPLLPDDLEVIDEARDTLADSISELVGDRDITWELRQIVDQPLQGLRRRNKRSGTDASSGGRRRPARSGQASSGGTLTTTGASIAGHQPTASVA
jgi:Universal stress protein family